MRDNEIQTFRVTKTDRPHCKLIATGPGGFPSILTEITYSVKKIEREDGEIYTNLYVVPGRGFKKLEEDDTFGCTHLDRKDCYEGQLGYAQCNPGWINYVWVNDGDPDDGRPLQMGKPVDARRCGISTLLTSLCLMDPTIYQPNNRDNQAIRYIKENDEQTKNNRMNDVETHCRNAFVALHMTSNPKAGAYGYLKAAIKENYNMMMIQARKSKMGKAVSSRFYYYNTETVLDNYDTQKGLVLPCECDAFGGIQQNQRCKGDDGYWYFCK